MFLLGDVECDINNSISVGLKNAMSDGSCHKPEGICFYRPQSATKSMLAYLAISAYGAPKKNL
jgi:hypothetical protein